MTTRKVSFSLNEFYHIYNRGVDKRIIFLDYQDKRRFISLLFLCNGSQPVVYKSVQALPLDEIQVGAKLVSIGAYCLMNNHFHILIKEIEEGGTVKFMSKLLTAYSSYFNKKYNRTGALFGSEFKSSHLDTDEYLKYIFAYIHLNPLKILDPDWKRESLGTETIKDFLNKYNYSSYTDYTMGSREESVILNKKAFPEYFSNKKDFEDYLYEWTDYPNDLSKGRAWTKLGITLCLILGWLVQSDYVVF